MSNTTRVIDRCGCARIVRCVVVFAALSWMCEGRVRGDFTYPDFASVAGLTLNNDATQAGSVLRLAANTVDQSGSAWYTASKAHVADGFDTTFTFQLSGSGSFGADGFAFVIQDDSTSALGNGGSGLGYEGIPRSIAIEFDTFGFSPENDNHISVQTKGNQGNSIEDVDSLGIILAPFDLNDEQPHTVLIRYRPGVLMVYLDGSGSPALIVSVDLQDINGDDILDGSGDAWVGFTGASGGVTQDHDILAWDFDETTAALPTGACCMAGGCVELTAPACASQGFYAGDDTLCAFESCNGACCTEGSCEDDIYIGDCILGGGTFLGVASVCDFNSCEGACCDAFGECFVTDEFNCTSGGGTFHGAGSTCTPFPCTLPPNGACCIDNECLMMDEANCANNSGTWYGIGTSCFDVNCFDPPSPMGACCQPGGSCVDGVTQAACRYFNGTYNGDGSLCVNSTCTEPCDCLGAVIVSPGSFFADSTLNEPVCDGGACSDPSPAKIYSYTPTEGGWTLINTCSGSDFDSVISVHSECPMTPANQIACDLNSCVTDAQVYFCAVAGQTYYVRVGGEAGASGNYNLLVIHFAGDIYEGPFQNPGNGHWYYHTNPGPWTGLETLAISKGGHLATVNDAAENAWLLATFTVNDIAMAIGFNDAAVEGTFEWASGAPVTYTNWQASQPDNLGEQDYAIINGAGEWEDHTDCNAGAYRGVIEVETVPLPGVVAGPIRNPGNCHDYYFTEPGTWIEQQLKAEALGGDLVTIDDSAENDWVRANFANYNKQEQAIWIGLSDFAGENTFVWADGSPVAYTNWSAGEPNDLGNEDYVMMNNAMTGEWNDAHSGIHLGGVIEIPTEHCPCQCQLGDMNCDDTVTTADIPEFVMAVLQSGGFAGCDIDLADMNGDTLINAQDTQDFVDKLLGL